MSKKSSFLKFLKQSRLAPWLFIVVTVVIGIFLKSLDRHLITRHSPNGMLSFQFSGNAFDAEDIRAAWIQQNNDEGSVIEVAIQSLLVDFIFMAAYGGLLLLILVRGETNEMLQFRKPLIGWLPLMTIGFDLLENIFSLLFLMELIEWTWIMKLLSSLKFIFLILCFVFMRSLLLKLSGYGRRTGKVLWTFRIVVISLIVLYLALWQSDQGQDLLVNLNTHPLGVIVFFSVVTVTAFLHWHLPKFLSKNTTLAWPTTMRGWIRALFFESIKYKNISPVTGGIQYIQDSDLARLFGIATFLIPAFGILNVMDKFQIDVFYPHAGLIGSFIIVLIVLRHNWLDNAFLKKNYRLVIILLFVSALLSLLWLANLNNRTPEHLKYLFRGLMALAFAFFIYVSVRHSVRTTTNPQVKPFVSVQFLGMCFAVLLMLLFIYANKFPLHLATTEDGPLPIKQESIRFSTISIFFCALVSYNLLFIVLIFWGRLTMTVIGGKPFRINVVGIFILIAVAFAIIADNRFHDVTLIENVSDVERSEPEKLSSYINGWLATRDSIIHRYSDNGRRFPVFIVNTYGGGVRASAWTSLSIAHLDQKVRRVTGAEDFQDHVFAYSGASGGTIGAAVMCSLRKSRTPDSISSLILFYENDFLSPIVTGLVGRDFFASTFGLNWEDRAKLQEQVWEHHMRHHFNDSIFTQSIREIWNPADTISYYRVPLLFSNTAQVERGLKGIVAPLKFDLTDFPSAIIVADSIRSEELLRIKESDRDMVRGVKLSTAAFFSARFPFISPAGRVNAKNHFLDGGIVENSGGETAAEIARVFQRQIDANEFWKRNIEIVILSLKNSPPFTPGKTKKNLFELSAPLKALVANVDGNAMHADSVNAVVFNKRYHRIYPQLPKDDKFSEHAAILPLGWQLSSSALNRLKINLNDSTTEANKAVNAVLGRFLKQQ